MSFGLIRFRMKELFIIFTLYLSGFILLIFNKFLTSLIFSQFLGINFKDLANYFNSENKLHPDSRLQFIVRLLGGSCILVASIFLIRKIMH